MKAKRTDEILRVMEIATRPLACDEILGKLDHSWSLRSLQRGLQLLVKAGDVEKTGKARATVYCANKRDEITSEIHHFNWRDSNKKPSIVAEESVEYKVTPTASDELSSVDFSESSLETISKVRKPILQRKAVGYKRELLDSYVPNETQYLPDELRRELEEVGQSDAMRDLPPGTHARMIVERLIIDLSWNSSRLEGNTYSLLETDELLKRGKTDNPRRRHEALMLLNHKSAIEFLITEPERLDFNRYTLFNLHSILTEHLMKNWKSEGTLRKIAVGIGGSVYFPSDNLALVEECFDLVLAKASQIEHPLEACMFALVHFPYLQAFEDGNKRTSRLAANIPLIKANFSPLSFIDVKSRNYTDALLSLYELRDIGPMRDVFRWAYKRSAQRYAFIRQEIGDPDAIAVAYHGEIKARMRDVIVQGLNKHEATEFLRSWAHRNVTASDREELLFQIEGRLLAVQMGNIARLQVRPSEFEAWWKKWDRYS